MAMKFDKDTVRWEGPRGAKVKTVQKQGMAMQSLSKLMDYVNGNRPVPKRVHKIRKELNRRGLQLHFNGESWEAISG